MTELIVALFELCVWDPNRDALCLLKHPFVDATFEIIFERIGVATKGSDPEFTPNPRSHTANGVVQSTIGVRVRFSMPSWVTGQRITFCPTVC